VSLFYIRTSKTGSSTVNDWCGVNISTTDNRDFLDSKNNYYMVNAAIDKGSTLFTTVRNPFTRAISCWQQAIRMSWIKDTRTFEEYFRWDYRTCTPHAYTHNCSITEYLSPFLGKIKIFIKMEELGHSLRHLEINYNLPEREIGFINKADYARNFDYRGFYTYERIKLVLDRFYVDFDTFNYSKSIMDI